MEASAELMEQMATGGAAYSAAIHAIQGSVVVLSFDQHACRVVQRALEVADEAIAASLAAELRGHVCAAIESPIMSLRRLSTSCLRTPHYLLSMRFLIGLRMLRVTCLAVGFLSAS